MFNKKMYVTFFIYKIYIRSIVDVYNFPALYDENHGSSVAIKTLDPAENRKTPNKQ
jgi:hypothetical protein